MTTRAQNWYVPLTDDGPVRLFAFPHAGAGCAQFAELAKAAAAEVSLWAANLPGRQARLEEPPPDDLDRLVETLADELTALDRRPYALFGYCGGALLAFLVARKLREYAVPAPIALVVASFEAPDVGRRPRGLSRLPSHQLWLRLRDDGGIPADLALDDRMRRVAEPAVRADFQLLDDYRHTIAPKLPCPITVCYGEQDDVRRGALLGWRRQTTAPVRLHPVPGGHWLLDHAVGELAAVIAAAVTPTGTGTVTGTEGGEAR
jgi:surfactin synthase thioesterase subunit